MQSDMPKQFLPINGVPVLMHTIQKFAAAVPEIELVLVLPSDQISIWKSLCVEYKFTVHVNLVEGGETRFQSVKNGLSVCESDGVIAIHDGVRPLISGALIQVCFETALKSGSALPVVPISQSLRQKRGESDSVPIDRSGMLSVQTPQCFHAGLIKASYGQPFNDSFTDDATVFEAAGHKVTLVEGEETNLKITTQADLKIAQAILGMSQGG
jgi:2-C-methyl-D-erythritol 4-phosphate cytidylyltransferase